MQAIETLEIVFLIIINEELIPLPIFLFYSEMTLYVQEKGVLVQILENHCTTRGLSSIEL